MRVSVGASSVVELSESCTIGWSDGSNRESTGSFISTGSWSRIPEILSRMSCDACWMSFWKTKNTVMFAKPSCAVPCMRSTPLMPEIASSTRSSTSRSTTSGEAPGYGIDTLTIGCVTSGNSSVCSCASENRPNTTSATIETMVTIGRLMAKSEMNTAAPQFFFGWSADGGAAETFTGAPGVIPCAAPMSRVSPAASPLVTSTMSDPSSRAPSVTSTTSAFPSFSRVTTGFTPR